MVLMVPLLIMATSLVSKLNTSVALLKGWVNSFLAFMGQLYLGFYNVGKAVFDPLPPLDESIYQTVAGHWGCDCIEKHFIGGRHEDAHWRQGGNWLKIMISRFGSHAILASPSKRTDLESRFGIHRDP